MKQLLYFLIGVLISGCLFLPLSNACDYDLSDLSWSGNQSGSEYMGTYGSQSAAISARTSHVSPGNLYLFNSSDSLGITNSGGSVVAVAVWGLIYDTSDGSYHNCLWVYSYVSGYDVCDSPGDSDGDGIQDKYDLKPDSASSYTAGIISVCYDQNHKVVAGVIQDSNGNQYSFGTMPTDMEGYTIESVTGNLITYQTAEDLATTLSKLNIDDLNITKRNNPVEIQDDGKIIPGSTDPFRDYRKAEEDQTPVKQPDVQTPPTVTPSPNDTDSKHFENIVKNTDATNKNLENIAKYLGISNEYLAKINAKTGSGTSVTVKGGGGLVVGTGSDMPSSDEIGQAVRDNLIDSGQTIDTTTTDNIPDLDETETLTAIKIKYSDRYDLFIDTLKDSDLFTLPFSIFTGPSGSGSSVQTVDIGSWGSSSSQTATIDFSQYDNVWDILSAVLLMLTSFACFKILVLKKA